jgi:uncharacterized repeat protein (TIGR03803 family)
MTNNLPAPVTSPFFSFRLRACLALMKPFISPVTLFWPNAAKWFTLSQGERAGVRAGVLLTSTWILLLLCVAPASAQNFIVISNLVSFNGTNGQQPSGTLLQAKDGNFYGTTLYGGTNAAYAGGIFRLSPSGGFTNLLFFNITDGANPNSGLIQGTDSNLYGTTVYGGASVSIDPNHNGFGTVFKATTNGALNTLASFNGTNGESPNALIETAPGVFYGSANAGGAFSNFAGLGFGTVFQANTNTPNNLLTNLLSFHDTNGASPSSGLIMTSDGTLYGTTASGGPFEYGTVFRLAANGAIALQFNFDFTNGAVPSALLVGRDGNLYGATTFGGLNRSGTLFKLTTNLVLTTLVNFDGTNGDSPTALTQGNDGNFYGLTSQSGAHGFGNVFELASNGVLIPLYNFTGGSDGYGGTSLVQGKDGNFYGATSYGGTDALGNIFKFSPLPTIQTIRQSAHTITLTWTAVSNLTYNVQYVTNCNQTNWTNLKSVTASSTVGTVTDSIGTNTQRFYRISLPQ